MGGQLTYKYRKMVQQIIEERFEAMGTIHFLRTTFFHALLQHHEQNPSLLDTSCRQFFPWPLAVLVLLPLPRVALQQLLFWDP